MITLQDCVAFCDSNPATVARTARQERLPELLAIACAHSRTVTAKRKFAGRPRTNLAADAPALRRAA